MITSYGVIVKGSPTLSFALSTATVLDYILHNSSSTLTIRGTDIASGDDLQYRYEDRSESLGPAPSVPLPGWVYPALGVALLLLGVRLARARVSR